MPIATSSAQGGHNFGRVVAVRGSVIDVEFPDHLPVMNHELRAGEDEDVVIEVASQLDPRTVRGIALNSIRELARGAVVRDLGRSLRVPVGKKLLGRMLDVFGQPAGSRRCKPSTCRPTTSPIRPRCIPSPTFPPPSYSHENGPRRDCTQPLIPLQSTSEMLLPQVVGQRHYRVARDVRQTLANYEDLKDIIAMLGMEELSRNDRRTVNRARRLERFLTQPFFTTEQFTGHEGRSVDRPILEGQNRPSR